VTEKATINVRNFNNGDVFTLGKILAKTSRSILAQIALLSEGKLDITEMGMTLFINILSEGGDDISVWLADMCGLTPELFLAQDKDGVTVFDAIDALIKKGDIKDFFGKASALVRALSTLRAS